MKTEPKYKVGQEVEILSAAGGRWIKGTVTGVADVYGVYVYDVLDIDNDISIRAESKVRRGRQLTLPTDSAERKRAPVFSGALAYFPAAIAAVSQLSYNGNEKHNPGQPMHWARTKSTDHADCIVRHLLDLKERERHTPDDREAIAEEAAALAWRALALCQVTLESLGMAPAPINASDSPC